MIGLLPLSTTLAAAGTTYHRDHAQADRLRAIANTHIDHGMRRLNDEQRARWDEEAEHG